MASLGKYCFGVWGGVLVLDTMNQHILLGWKYFQECSRWNRTFFMITSESTPNCFFTISASWYRSWFQLRWCLRWSLAKLRSKDLRMLRQALQQQKFQRRVLVQTAPVNRMPNDTDFRYWKNELYFWLFCGTADCIALTIALFGWAKAQSLSWKFSCRCRLWTSLRFWNLLDFDNMIYYMLLFLLLYW